MYPLAVEMWPAMRPAGVDANIAAEIVPKSLQHFDYWPQSLSWANQLRVFNTTAHPWWVGEPGPDDLLGPFSSAFSSAFRVDD